VRFTETVRSRRYKRSGPSGLARRASAASATTESGGEAEKAGGSGRVGGGWARAAELAEPECASHSEAARDFLGTWREGLQAIMFLRLRVV
jgi:hypothetical protein